MIITSQFVILNFPKTGSSFVRKIISTLYRNRANRNNFNKILVKLKIRHLGYTELKLPHPTILNYKDQHGSYSQIPKRHKNKSIISVIRDPYQRFESQYKFRWWVEHSGIEERILRKYFPYFPDISMDEFVILRKLITEKLKLQFHIPKETEIGDQSIQFINMFFKNPSDTFKTLTPAYVSNDQFIKDMCDIEFLRQEHLNEDLLSCLKDYGFSDKELEFIRTHEKVNVTDNSGCNNNNLTKSAVAYIEKSEWILFEILTSKKINYPKPDY